MIVLLGATGYIGQAFARALRERQQDFTALSRKEFDYTRFDVLLNFLRENRPDFLINAAGYTGKPNVDACEEARADTLAGNTLFAQTIAQACLVTRTPWGHVSSGCIYSGAKIRSDGDWRIEKDFSQPHLKNLAVKSPEAIRGYQEMDAPNFSFRQPPCSFYSGTKALAEEAIVGLGQTYLWRLRIPFDEFDNPRNYLTKVQRYPKVYDNVNSISHRGDFVHACLDLWDRRASFGIYNMTNPGFVTTRQVVEMIQAILKPKRSFEFWESDEEFYRLAAKTPRSNCVLDVSKLLATGVKLRTVTEALEDSLRNWQSEPAR
jgi:dTDP-4-dehydrorhamnose reductase